MPAARQRHRFVKPRHFRYAKKTNTPHLWGDPSTWTRYTISIQTKHIKYLLVWAMPSEPAWCVRNLPSSRSTPSTLRLATSQAAWSTFTTYMHRFHMTRLRSGYTVESWSSRHPVQLKNSRRNSKQDHASVSPTRKYPLITNNRPSTAN